MAKLFFAVVFLFCAWNTFAQPTPCNVPQQFQTKSFAVILGDTGCATASIFQDLYFDYPNQQLRVDQVLNVQGTPTVYSVWLLYSQGIQVVYNRVNGQCTVAELDGTLPAPVIPSDASFQGTYVVGAQAVNVWSIPGQDESDLDGVATLTQGTCFLVSQTAFNSTTGSVNYVGNFWDFIPSLPLFAFDYPSVCKTDAKRATPSMMPKLKNFRQVVNPLERIQEL